MHSESVEELSDIPDQPLSASDPLSSLATIARSTLLLSAEAFLSTGMRLGVSENLFTGKCSRWVSSATGQEGILKAWRAAARQGLCGWRQKASKKCSQRSNERTFVQSNPITFPGVNAPEGLLHSRSGPKHVARKVTAIHCIFKDISELVSFLISLPRDGVFQHSLAHLST